MEKIINLQNKTSLLFHPSIYSNDEFDYLIPPKKPKTKQSPSAIPTAVVPFAGQPTIPKEQQLIQTTNTLPLSKRHRNVPKPVWHSPYKLYRVISGHTGWVRSIAVDTSNEWFATGAADRIIKVWDLASGSLKLSLTGHIGTVRGLAVSSRHPYLFSVGDDKMFKCWDLEQNKVVRQFHGHLSGIYCVGIHPTLDLLVSGGRDATARVWDMRSRRCVTVLTGHDSTIASLVVQSVDPQIITGSMDSTVRLWDLRNTKALNILTHHKKSVRSIVLSPTEFTFCTASPDNIKQWLLPEGQFMQNLTGHNTIINTLSINDDNVLFSGGDDGSMCFWDWKSGYQFQQTKTIPQSGSMENENGIFASSFDKTGTRLITCEADKSIKMWKVDEEATESEYPIDKAWKPQ